MAEVTIKELSFMLILIIVMCFSIFTLYHDKLFINKYVQEYHSQAKGIYDETVFEEYDLISFEKYVNDNYEYILDVKDCKFYSILWDKYFTHKGWDTKFITTDNHIFTMAFKDDVYCIADQNKLECTQLGGN